MNLFGKILVMLVLISSLVYMTAAAMVIMTHQNFRDVVENTDTSGGKPLGLKLQLANLRTRNQELQAQMGQLQQDLNSEKELRSNQLAKLEQKAEELRRERDEARRDLDQLVESQRTAAAALEAAHLSLKGTRDELGQLRTDIRTAQEERNDQFVEMVRLQDLLHSAEGDRSLLEERNRLLVQQIALADSVLERHDLNRFEPADGPPRVDGKVLAVNAEGLLEISIGSDDGLARGHTLEVFRREANRRKYLGRVEVVRITPDKAVAKIIPSYRKGAIRKEDRVATRLN
jgi:hypothetical protein